MSNNAWFRFRYPPCPSDLNERQKIRKYQILQYNSVYKNKQFTKAERYKYAVSNNRNVTKKTQLCPGYNPPNCSDVPGSSWDLVVTNDIINSKSIINNKINIPQSGPRYF